MCSVLNKGRKPLQRKESSNMVKATTIKLIVPILLPGFQSIHESLELLRQIHNAKLNLEKKKIHKDMKKVQQK